MRLLGVHALYQRPRTSQPHPAHRIYPYLLRDLPITRPNHVWCTDVTYIPLRRGFLYLVAVMDWARRTVLSWRLSNTLDASFCVEALHEALERYGPPEIFNSDQGSQFTSVDFTDVLTEAGIRISMDGKGRWMDNVFIERLWRSLKYECVYLSEFAFTRLSVPFAKPRRLPGTGGLPRLEQPLLAVEDVPHSWVGPPTWR